MFATNLTAGGPLKEVLKGIVKALQIPAARYQEPRKGSFRCETMATCDTGSLSDEKVWRT